MRHWLSLIGLVAAFSAGATNYPSWSGTEGDYTDPAMWYNGVVASVKEDCANLSRTAAGEATAYIREGMCITNGWINCGRTNDFNIVQSGGFVLLTQSENVDDAALKLSRGDVVNNVTIRPTGNYTMTGGKLVATNGCISVGERGTGILTMTGGEIWAQSRLSIARLEGSSGTLSVSGGAKITAYSFNLARPEAKLSIDGGIVAGWRNLSKKPRDGSFIWGNKAAIVEVGANGAEFWLRDDRALEIPIRSIAGTAGTITKTGPGTMRIYAGVTNTYAGTLVVAAGTVVADEPAGLPGYAEPGRVVVKSGAQLLLGSAWTEAEKAALAANATIEGDAQVGASFYIVGDHVTIADDLTYAGGFEKYGDKMLTLSGHNVFGGEQIVYGGTLRADFGQGLDAGYCVTLAGGWLSSLVGNITTTIGGGPGQIKTTTEPTAFTARGVPLVVDLLNGVGSADAYDHLFVTNAVPSRHLILNGELSSHPLTFANNLNITGVDANNPFKITVYNTNVVTLAGSIMDSTYSTSLQTTFKKYGPGTLRFAGVGVRDRCFRFNVEEGNAILDHPASITSGSNGSGYFFYINMNSSGTFAATNQNITTADNFNITAGTMILKDGKVKVGNGLNANGGVTFLDGGVATTKNTYAATGANQSGTLILTNGVQVITSNEFAAGGNNNNSYGRIEINEGCIVTSKYVFAVSGDIVQRGGVVYATDTGSPARLGRYAKHKGFYYLSGGVFGNASYLHLGRDPGAYGLLKVSGGAVETKNLISIGNGANATGVVHVVGGELRQNSLRTRVGENGVGELVVRGTGVVRNAQMISLADNSSSGSGRAMLCNGGLIEATQVLGHGKTTNGRYAEFIFDGGTLKAMADSTTYASNLTAFAVGTGGGKVNSNGHDIAFAQPLTATRLNSDLTHRWSFSDTFVDSVTGQSPVGTNGWSFINKDSGRAVKLAGGSKGTSHINLGPGMLPVDGSDMTIEAWIIVDTHRSYQRLFDIGVDGNNYTAFCLRRNAANTDLCSTKYKGVQKSATDTLQPYYVNSGKWYHVSAVYHQDAEGKWKITVRKRGLNEDANKTGEYEPPEGWSLANQDQSYFYIGRSLQSDNDSSISIDEFRIWKRALTAEELEEHAVLGPDTLPATAFEKLGEGTLTLAGANTYEQPTVVKGGTLALAADASLPATTAITVDDGATLDLGGNAAAAASLAGEGTLANGTLALTGAADISAMHFVLNDESMLSPSGSTTMLSAEAGVTGRFASAVLPNGYRLVYKANEVQAVPGGLVIYIR